MLLELVPAVVPTQVPGEDKPRVELLANLLVVVLVSWEMSILAGVGIAGSGTEPVPVPEEKQIPQVVLGAFGWKDGLVGLAANLVIWNSC